MHHEFLNLQGWVQIRPCFQVWQLRSKLLFTLFALTLIDKFGRRKLMLIGTIGLIASLGIVAYLFFSKESNPMAPFSCCFVYIAFFAMSQEPAFGCLFQKYFLTAYGQRAKRLAALHMGNGYYHHVCVSGN